MKERSIPGREKKFERKWQVRKKRRQNKSRVNEILLDFFGIYCSEILILKFKFYCPVQNLKEQKYAE